MQSRFEAIGSNASWLIFLLCPAMHIFMCYRMHRAGESAPTLTARKDSQDQAGN
jgi:hypothetical protein